MKTYTTIWKDTTFSVYFFGEVTLKDLIAVNDELIANQKLDSVTHYYLDFCNVETLNLSDNELKSFAKYDSAMPKLLRRTHMRGAIRVPTTTMKDQWNQFLEWGHTEWPRKVFTSCILAETWVQDRVFQTASGRVRSEVGCAAIA